jgi:hypothetical protein
VRGLKDLHGMASHGVDGGMGGWVVDFRRVRLVCYYMVRLLYGEVGMERGAIFLCCM